MNQFTKMRRSQTVACTAGIMALAASSFGQSADALIDKLVEKGILSVKEANTLREETDKGFNQAYSVKSGMPDWVTSLKLNGDFRGRYEQNASENPAYTDRNRFRYRARFGVTVTMLEDFEVGLRLASGNAVGTFGGNPLSANTDMSDGASRKFVWFDAAYAKWTPINKGGWMLSATIGKMDNPFQLSNMIFDYDYQPEGAALQAAYNINDRQALKFNGGLFVLDEFNQDQTVPATSNSRDPYMGGAQLLWESKWTDKVETSFGVAVMSIGNKENNRNTTAPNVNDGNTRDGNGASLYDYNPVILTGAATYKLDSFPLYKEAFPIKVNGEYMNNPAAPQQNIGWNAGFVLGKAGKKGLWEVAYKYERLEANSWYEEVVDDDFGAFYQQQFPNAGFNTASNPQGSGWRGGTNVKGHVVKFTYNLTDAMNLAFTYYRTSLILPSPTTSISESTHLMLDLMWKF